MKNREIQKNPKIGDIKEILRIQEIWENPKIVGNFNKIENEENFY